MSSTTTIFASHRLPAEYHGKLAVACGSMLIVGFDTYGNLNAALTWRLEDCATFDDVAEATEFAVECTLRNRNVFEVVTLDVTVL